MVRLFIRWLTVRVCHGPLRDSFPRRARSAWLLRLLGRSAKYPRAGRMKHDDVREDHPDREAESGGPPAGPLARALVVAKARRHREPPKANGEMERHTRGAHQVRGAPPRHAVRQGGQNPPPKPSPAPRLRGARQARRSEARASASREKPGPRPRSHARGCRAAANTGFGRRVLVASPRATLRSWRAAAGARGPAATRAPRSPASRGWRSPRLRTPFAREAHAR